MTSLRSAAALTDENARCSCRGGAARATLLADPVHLGHHRLSEGGHADAMTTCCATPGGGPALRRTARRPLFQLPAVLPCRRHHPVPAAALAHGAVPVTLPTFEAGAALGMMERERCTLISGNDTHVPDADGPRRLRRGAALPARRLGGGRAADHAPDHRGVRREGDLRRYGLSEASPNVVMSDWRDAEALHRRLASRSLAWRCLVDPATGAVPRDRARSRCAAGT